MKKVHEDMVNIQVENSTLQSQSSSLLSQINQLQITLGDLEAFKRKVSQFLSQINTGIRQEGQKSPIGCGSHRTKSTWGETFKLAFIPFPLL